MSQEESCLIAKQNGDERLLRRVQGHIGQVETLRGRHSISQYEQTRRISGEDLAALWERFRMRVEPGASEDDDLEAAVAAWHSKLRAKCADLLVAFTPLDAEERLPSDEALEVPVPREVFEPRATETLPDYLRDEPFDESSDDDQENSEEDEPADDLDESDPDEEDLEEGDELVKRQARRGGLFDLLAQEPRAAVVGEPGGGKTTCLRRLALDAALAYQPGREVALYIPLGLWLKAGDLWMLIRRVTGLSPAHVEQLITARRCRLLLDALNECPDALRTAALTSISHMLREHPDLPVVITARTQETIASLRLPTFAVEPLSRDQQRAFLVAYLKDSRTAEALLVRIASRPGGESLASNPLLLRMIVEVARSGEDLPIGRATLYRRWIEDWHKRETLKAKKAGDPLTWTPEKTRKALAAIALASRRKGKRFASEDLAFDCVAPLVEKPERFLDRMTQGPLILREEGRIEFRHETFQEYLCAEALLANPEAIPTNILSDKTTWGMVIVQAAHLCKGKLPKPLAEAAWAMDPWLGAALDPREELPAQTKEVVKTWASHERHALYYFCGGGITKKLSGYILKHYFRRGGIAKKLSGCGGRYWYDAKDPALREAVEVISGVRNRWQNFEATLLGSVIGRPGRARRLFEWLLCSGPELLKVVCPERDGKAPVFWIERANPINAQKFVQLGLFSAQDFEQRRPKWIATATPGQAVVLIKAGICSPQDFAERIQRWATKKDCSRRLKKTVSELISRLLKKSSKNLNTVFWRGI